MTSSPSSSAAPAAGTRQTIAHLRVGLRVIAAVIFTLGLSLFVFSGETDTLFAWTIKVPLTAAFLGASYWASTTLALCCAGERDWVAARAFAAPYLIAGIVLLVVTFVHLDLFHMDDVTGWLWLVLYAAFPGSMIVLLSQQMRVAGTDPPRTAPVPAAFVAICFVQAAVMVSLGTALVIAPTDVSSLWPWPLTPLTGRAVGTFVLSQGVLVLTVCRERDWGRVRPAMMQYVVLGVLHLVAVARFSDTFDWHDAVSWVYLGFIVSILLTAVYGVVHVFGAVRDGTASDAPALYRRTA